MGMMVDEILSHSLLFRQGQRLEEIVKMSVFRGFGVDQEPGMADGP
jgi:hypothetical protein